MKKIVISGVCATLLLLMIPIVTVGAVISNPLGFLGEVMFGNGNNTEKDKDQIETLYNLFLNSDIGINVAAYLHELEVEENVSDTDILLPFILSFNNESLSSLDTYTMESLNAKDKIDILYNLRIKNSDDMDYLTAVKKENDFQLLNSFSDTSLLAYLENIKNNIHSNSSNSLDINVDSDLYQKDNPFIPTYRGQCTWFVYCRALEVTGKIMPTGNARDWLKQTNLPTGNTPKTHAVAVFAGSDGSQHVLFIEKYEGEKITFSEGNYDNPCYDGSCDMVNYANTHYKELVNVQTMPYNAFIIQRETNMDLLGFIYTEEK